MGMRSSDRILELLADGELWTGTSLAQQSGLSLRSVRRGLAQLQNEGVTLDSEPGRGGGVRLTRRSGLPRMALSQREVMTLLMGLAVAESYGAPLLATELRSLRRKLGLVLGGGERAVQQQLRQRVLLGSAASEAVRADWHSPRPAALAQVQEAFFAQQCLQIRYRDGQGQTSQRDIEPQYLLINAPVWYVLAWDTAKQAPRCFRLDRIEFAQVLHSGFLRRPASRLMEEQAQFFAML
jgi:predicted DNA-binding transcriptional regulator YafY